LPAYRSSYGSSRCFFANATQPNRTVSTLGFNTGYVEELYRQYLENPESVSESWREFFADYRPGESFVAARETTQAPAEAPAAVGRPGGDGAAPEEAVSELAPEEVEAHPLRGPAARIVENMEASLKVPTATSVRTISVRLLAENRALINDYQRHVGGEKVSFTHLIAWAVVQALKAFPNMNATFRRDDGTPIHVQPKTVNLGIAIDLERRGSACCWCPTSSTPIA